MQERQVTAGGKKHELDAPFFVLATQNPIEQEGTYPLPEAQLDRFMFMVKVDYPTLEQEVQIVERTTRPVDISYAEVLTGQEILEIQDVVRRVPISEHVVRYVLRLVRATRVQHRRGARLGARARRVGRRSARQPVPGAREPRRGHCSTAAST